MQIYRQCMCLLRGGAVGRGVGLRLDPEPSSSMLSELSTTVESANWYRTCLGRIKY